MKYALERLDRIIYEKLDVDKLESSEEDMGLVDSLTRAVSDELGAARLCLIQCSVEYTKEKAFEFFVQQYQVGMIDLLDRVYAYKVNYLGHWMQPVYERVMQLLEDMLTHIERRYTKYFNQDAKVPELYLKLMQQEMGEQWKLLQRSARFKGLDADLVRMAMNPLQLFSKNKWGASITYSRMLYIKELLSELLDVAEGAVYTDTKLILLLVYMNFNTPEMVRCITGVLLSEVNLLRDGVLQKERLMCWVKELNQCQVKPGMGIVREGCSLKVELVGWVTEELEYFEQQQRLFVEPRERRRSSSAALGRLRMNLSVQCLGVLVRSATEEGLVLDESVVGAIEKASRLFTTLRSEGPSGASMRTKSYRPSAREKEQVVGPLYGMIRRIGQY